MAKALTDIYIQENSSATPAGYNPIYADINCGIGGNDQNISVKYEPITNGDQLIVTKVFQAKDGGCGTAKKQSGASYWGMGNKCNGRYNTCIETKPVKDAIEYIDWAIGDDSQSSACPFGYYNVSDFRTGCGGNFRKLCLKTTPLNYLQDMYCLPGNGTSMETPDCRNTFKIQNEPIFLNRVKEYCSNNPGVKFAAPDGVCRYESQMHPDPDYDELVRQYCLQNPKDSFCNCTINSLKSRFNPNSDDPEIFDVMIANPQCFPIMGCSTADSKAYRFPPQRANRACDIVIQRCDIKISNVVGSDIKNVYCQQTVERKAAEQATLAEQAKSQTQQQTNLEAQKQAAQAAANANAARIAAQNTSKPAEIKARNEAIARGKAEQERVLAEKKTQQFLPLPDSIREITDQWDVPDTVLAGGFIMFLIIILYIAGIFDDDDEEQPESPYIGNFYNQPQMMPQYV